MLTLEQARETLERRTRQQSQLIETARHLTSSLEPGEVLARIGRGAKDILHARSCAIYLLEEDGKTLVPAVADDPQYEREVLAASLEVESSFTGQAVRAKQALLFNDAVSDATGYQIPGTPVEEDERIVVAPFVVDGKVLGAMCLSRIGTRFSDEDLALVETFAAYASTALQNARVYRDLQREVEDRRRAEEALRDSEARYRMTIDAMGDVVHVIDRDLRLVLYNDQTRLLARESGFTGDLVGANLFSLFPFLPSSARDEYCRVFESGQRLLTEERVRLGDGSRWTETRKIPVFDEEGGVHRVITIVRDITDRRQTEDERRELEAKLERARRMESLGVLAGGVAHDLNNLLGPLVAYPDLILEELSDGNPWREELVQIKDAAERAAAVVQDLLTLARRGAYHMAPLNLNSLVSEYLHSPSCMDLKGRNPGTQVDAVLAPDLLNVSGSAAHLSKVLMNLVTNAFEAMPDGGRLTIRTSCQTLDRPMAGYESIPAGDYVVLSIRDTGVGIEEKHLGMIFEPFFTKKEMGRSGSGLGLAVVYGVVHDHRGRIDVKTQVGKGAEFVVYLPVSRDPLPEPDDQDLDYRGHERILVVDDLEEQRTLATRLLSSLGYRVTAVSSGREAIEYLKQERADVLLLDMIMEEEFDGLDTFREIARMCSAEGKVPRVVIASGFSATDRVKEAQRLGAGPFVRKPYTLRVLGRAIRGELDKLLRQ